MAYTNPVDAITGNAMRDLLGVHASKAHNVAELTPFAVDLFTVTGANLINLIYGEVTTVIATTTTVLLRRETGTVQMAAATTITSDAVGTMYMWSGDRGEVLSGASAPVVGFANVEDDSHNPVVFGLAGGSEVIQAVCDQAGTGVITWHIYSTPLESGASIVAA